MTGLTYAQAQAFDLIKPLFRCGASPTLDAIAAHTGLASRSGAHRLVDALVQAGRIRRIRTEGARTRLELTNEADQLRSFSDAALLAEVQRRGLST